MATQSPRIPVDERPADPIDLTFPGWQPTNDSNVPSSAGPIRSALDHETVFSDEKQSVHTLFSPLADALTVGNLSYSSPCRHCLVMEAPRQARCDLKFLDGKSIPNGREQERR